MTDLARSIGLPVHRHASNHHHRRHKQLRHFTGMAMPVRNSLAERMTLGQVMRRADLWVTYLAVTLMTGAGSVIFNQLGQIAQSFGAPEASSSVYVALTSVANCLGRIVSGVAADKLHGTVPRPLVLASGMAFMAAAHFMLTTGAESVLLPSFVFCGFATGAFW
jgi:hypothetical protein